MHERSRPPVRRAGAFRETSGCQARRRRRRPASGRAVPCGHGRPASCAFNVALPVSGPKLSVFRRLPSASWKLTVPQDASRQHASSSPSGRSGTPSSETAHGFAGFRLADAVHGLPLRFLPETARRFQQTLQVARRRVHASQLSEEFGRFPRRAMVQNQESAVRRRTQLSNRPKLSSTGENDGLPGERYGERENATGPNRV